MKKKSKSELQIVRDDCANYQANYICLGVMLEGADMWIDEEMHGKECLIKQGKECLYFDLIVKKGETK